MDKEGSTYYPSNEAAGVIYENTPVGSPARQLIVDLWVLNADCNWVDRHLGNLSEPNHEFMRDVARALMENRPRPGKTYEGLDSGMPCAYHKHGKDKPCGGEMA